MYQLCIMVLWFNGKVVGVYTKGPWFNSWREQPVLFFFDKTNENCGHAPSLRTQERGIRLVSSALAKLRMFLTTQFFQNQDFVYKNSIDHDTDLAKFSLFLENKKSASSTKGWQSAFLIFSEVSKKIPCNRAQVYYKKIARARIWSRHLLGAHPRPYSLSRVVSYSNMCHTKVLLFLSLIDHSAIVWCDQLYPNPLCNKITNIDSWTHFC